MKTGFSWSATVILMALAASCDDPPAPDDLLGDWGGEHILLTVTSAGGSLEFDCASGTMDEPVVPDNDGRFETRGTYTPGKGGPDIEGEEPDSFPALYQGTTDGEAMTLAVRLDTGENIGPFLLRLGAPPRVYKCL